MFAERIRELVPIENIGVNQLFEEVDMDSIAFITMIIEIEKIFQVVFPEDKLSFEEAGSIEKICKILENMEVKI